jgi:hypothetical protein
VFANNFCVVVLTNVRGPDNWMPLEGRRVEATLGFLPLQPGIPEGVVCYSYANQVSLTITAKPWAVPDADLFLSLSIFITRGNCQ